jgi:HAD superfamily hydrolase (TIGR01509 family)
MGRHPKIVAREVMDTDGSPAMHWQILKKGPHMPLRAVIFDLDDTLHDKSATLRAVAKRLHADHGLSTGGVKLDDWASRFVALNNLRIEKIEVFEKLGIAFAMPGALSGSLLEDFDANLGSQAQPYPGAMECLAACQAAGLKVGLVTNGRDAFQRSKIAELGALPYLDAIFTSGGFGAKKPDLAIFEACLKVLDVHASEAAMVGDDRCCDVEPAIALGMTVIWKSSERAGDVALSTHDFREIQAWLVSAATVQELP